jgi:dolichyl-phosphate-mannose--protein O-mannosyl transferase
VGAGRPLRPRERLFGWLGPIGISLIALAMRLHGITNPRCLMFDEAYYPSDARSLFQHGVEGRFSAAVRTCEGAATTNSSYAYPSHPPLGKWMIGLGEQIYGFTPLGWRFSNAIVGALCVLLVARIGRRLTRSTLLGCLAGVLVAADGLEFTFSRAGLLDIDVLFWLLAALACLLADREAGRARLAARAEGLEGAARWPGPRLGIRWWRVGTGLCLGALCSTKWSGLPFVALFALLALAWDAGARRVLGVRAPVRAALWRDGVHAAVAFLLLPVVVYTASYTGYFAAKTGWDRMYHHVENGSGPVPTLRAWWHWHHDVLCFHENLQNDPHKDSCSGNHDDASHHSYESKPFGWLVLGRPVLFAYDSVKDGERTKDAGPAGGQVCHAAGDSQGCSRTVLAVGTPALWWAGLLALLGCAGLFAARRDWRAGLMVALFTAGFVPWLGNTERVMFLFYALPLVPVFALSIVLVASYALGGPEAPRLRRMLAAGGAAILTLVVLADFFWLLPVLSGKLIPYHEWNSRVIGTWGFPGWL